MPIDTSGRILQVNRAAERIFGYRREEVVGRPLADVIIPENLRADSAGLLPVIAGQEPRILDRRVALGAVRRNGEEFPAELAVTQTRESPLAWTAFIRDLTALAVAEPHANPAVGSRSTSSRELDVLRLAAEGNTGPQIAAQLSLSPATVKTHFEKIYDKLGVGDRAAAVARAMRIGLIR